MKLSNIFASLTVIILGFIIYFSIKKIMEKGRKKAKKNALLNSTSSTYIYMLYSLIKYVIIIIISLIVLQINGINVSSMLAGIGILSVIIGLAVQDALKDIIRGISILSEDYYKVGDVVKIDENIGKVINFDLKTTKIKDLYTDNIVSIANRNIEKVEIISTTVNIDIPLPYELKLSKAEKIISEILENVKEIKLVDNCEYRNISNFSESSIDYRLYIEAKPEDTIKARREVLKQILVVLENNKVSIPYNQLDIHNK